MLRRRTGRNAPAEDRAECSGGGHSGTSPVEDSKKSPTGETIEISFRGTQRKRPRGGCACAGGQKCPRLCSATDMADELIEQRKADHLRLSATGDVEASTPAGWNDVRLVHEALPEVDFDEIDLRAEFLGHRLAAPLLIAGMTGGHSTAREVNAVLARAAERHGLAMGVGSQRAALRRSELASTYAVVREHAPTAFLIGNVGAPQLIGQGDAPPLRVDEIQAAIDMIRADALAIHLNVLQESVQPEGDRNARGGAEAIRQVVRQVGVPVVGKETGAGLSRRTALRLRTLGLKALDVGGLGGTSFAAVEGLRAEAQGESASQRLGAVFRDWGIPTPVSVIAALAAGLPIIATGGIRTGLDAAKAVVLGATLVGVARPLLQAALQGDAAVDVWITQFLNELRTTLFLTGSEDLAALRGKPRVISGPTRDWIAQLT
jgi:isopentenyl-diphosphate delta-isomerase